MSRKSTQEGTGSNVAGKRTGEGFNEVKRGLSPFFYLLLVPLRGE
jgi:hypothetical protein